MKISTTEADDCWRQLSLRECIALQAGPPPEWFQLPDADLSRQLTEEGQSKLRLLRRQAAWPWFYAALILGLPVELPNDLGWVIPPGKDSTSEGMWFSYYGEYLAIA